MRQRQHKTSKVQLPFALRCVRVTLLVCVCLCVWHGAAPNLSSAEAAKSKATTPTPTVANSTTAAERRDECGHTMNRPPGFFDGRFWKFFVRHLNPFGGRERAKMQFFLYKRDFPDCGRELRLDDEESIQYAGFNASQPTRVLIHGWMSQGRGKLSRYVKRAYLSLLNDTQHNNNNNNNDNSETMTTTKASASRREQIPDDYNIVIVDWGLQSTNVNYYGVVAVMEDLGFLLAELLRFLHMHAAMQFSDVYLIGHSMGAQIAGSAGKQLQPHRVNTIYALDPAGPKFRKLNIEQRLDASDADYVESIQTSSNFGFAEPVGHATFYPNFGKSQRSCYVYGCSHRRSYHYFAESLTSDVGFWGTRVEKQPNGKWLLNVESEYLMGGEPSTPKNGTFYVKTNKKSPFALGKQRVPLEGNRVFEPEASTGAETETESDDDSGDEDDRDDESLAAHGNALNARV